ncbi:hypothetical protein D8674_043007 [Pyrus ussuriensis x Pyrus communis]|uniref:Uncharacterized protein n=1 Tax=Pyrus ussuriensis x Pyrus communis TaxID=2448454 RepID=A0A5N5GZF0_9ROSA|nr:hypothetical protein D8674_043007 [Pyrus ussuriensis x Pyrus communis]
MKIKNKGKVHPSPFSSSASSSASSSSSDGYVLSVLQLLPAAILALASVLSLEDREVLAYLITRSMKTTPNTSSSTSIPAAQDPKKKTSKKGSNKSASNPAAAAHQPPMFDCDCFDCYRSYWFKWDSSPNRELIHQAIEAFEDHLANGERPKRNARGKRRDKMGRRDSPKTPDVSAQNDIFQEENVAPASPEFVQSSTTAVLPEIDVVFVGSPEKADAVEGNEGKVEDLGVDVAVAPPDTADDMAVVLRAAAASNHRGLARKVLPDVLGLFNSRLWNLWSPNV